MFDLYRYTWSISGCFALSACLLSLHLIYKHLQNYTQPHLQRYIVRILWLIPIYAVDSFLSLRYYDSSLYFDVWRDCYEAYVLYSFFSLLIAYLDGIEVLEEIIELKPPTAHPFPCCFLPKFTPNQKFLLWCRRFVLQFVIVKPILACLALLLEMEDLYHDGSFQLTSGYLYIAAINNISITLSLYYLVLFYMVTEENLEPYKPLPQFLCVKALIFFSFWFFSILLVAFVTRETNCSVRQGIIIVALVKFHLIVPIGNFTSENIALFFQNFLICIEMFVFAIIHRHVFSYEKFVRPATEFSRDVEAAEVKIQATSPKANAVLKNLQDVADVSDVIGDAREILRPVPKKHTKNY